MNYTIVGIDGGASKMSAWIINYNKQKSAFSMTDIHAEKSYHEYRGFLPDFKPVNIHTQLNEMKTRITLTEPEIKQGKIFISAFIDILKDISRQTDKPLLVGVGMPGLKTKDKRGIAALANGPRMPNFCKTVEDGLAKRSVQLIAPIYYLGSDADYCGIGEEYSEFGQFKSVTNAYYLGGGTGTADALKIKGKLVPLDNTKSWLAKTWEMKNEAGISLERYTSAGGIQSIYSTYSKRTVKDIQKNNIYPNIILEMANNKDVAAVSTYKDISLYLAKLIYERVSTLYCGTQKIFDFINPDRAKLTINHSYEGLLFDKIIIGQRLGDLLEKAKTSKILYHPFIEHLSLMIYQSSCLGQPAKNHYLCDRKLKDGILVISSLREAPALGAGIDAFLSYGN